MRTDCQENRRLFQHFFDIFFGNRAGRAERSAHRERQQARLERKVAFGIEIAQAGADVHRRAEGEHHAQGRYALAQPHGHGRRDDYFRAALVYEVDIVLVEIRTARNERAVQQAVFMRETDGSHSVALVARPHLFQGAAGGHDDFAAAGQHVIHDRVRRRVAHEQRRKIYVALEGPGKAVGHDAEKFRAWDMRIRFAGIENAQVAARAFRRFDVERQCVEHIRVSVLL